MKVARVPLRYLEVVALCPLPQRLIVLKSGPILRAASARRAWHAAKLASTSSIPKKNARGTRRAGAREPLHFE